jgi:formyltetrahydrofolate deformylase
MMKTAKLLLHCPDQPGILAEVTDFITVNKGNIIYLDQYVDHVENIFFMRIEWELESFLVPQEKIEDYFETLYAQKYGMSFRLYFSDVKPRMAIFVSKMSHCLFDLLARYTAGEWNVEIPLIISNHPDLQHVAERFGIPFHLFPITKETKEEQEKKEMELLVKHKVNFIVLARYMQVISGKMIDAYPNHISFLRMATHQLHSQTDTQHRLTQFFYQSAHSAGIQEIHGCFRFTHSGENDFIRST